MTEFEKKSEGLRAIVIESDGKSYDIKPRNAYFTEEELREFFVGNFVIDLFYDANVLIHDEDLGTIDWDALTEKRTPEFFSMSDSEGLEQFVDDLASQGHDVNKVASIIKMHFEDKMIFPIIGRAIMCPIGLLDRCVLKHMIFRKYLEDKEFNNKVASMREEEG
jgi:hypothetical protein